MPAIQIRKVNNVFNLRNSNWSRWYGTLCVLVFAIFYKYFLNPGEKAQALYDIPSIRNIKYRSFIFIFPNTQLKLFTFCRVNNKAACSEFKLFRRCQYFCLQYSKFFKSALQGSHYSINLSSYTSTLSGVHFKKAAILCNMINGCIYNSFDGFICNIKVLK